jgi:hypothetical protein
MACMAHGWRDYHRESFLARLPFVHSCIDDAAIQMELRRSDERRATSDRQGRAACGAQPRRVICLWDSSSCYACWQAGVPGVGAGYRLRGGCPPSVGPAQAAWCCLAMPGRGAALASCRFYFTSLFWRLRMAAGRGHVAITTDLFPRACPLFVHSSTDDAAIQVELRRST